MVCDRGKVYKTRLVINNLKANKNIILDFESIN